ncbi:MAG: amidohydrolase family protein, partial [Polyangiales bacterium]
MSIVPWALASRRIVVDGLLRPGVVLVGADGRVVDVVETVDHVPAGYVLRDVGELAVSPGLVDCHVHINEPGRTDWEGYVTATRAAAAGGITSLVDMPLNCIPVTTSADALAQKLAACRAACAVDVGFWGGVV